MSEPKNWIIFFLVVLLIGGGYYLYQNCQTQVMGKVSEKGTDKQKSKLFRSEIDDSTLKKSRVLGWWEPIEAFQKENMDDSRISILMSHHLILREDISVEIAGEACKTPDYKYNPKPRAQKGESVRAFFRRFYRLDIDELKFVDEGDTIHSFEIECAGSPVTGFEFIEKEERDLILFNYNAVNFIMEKTAEP